MKEDAGWEKMLEMLVLQVSHLISFIDSVVMIPSRGHQD